MALSFDPYAVLGVSRDASDDQIARARRRLSREYHPDVNRAPDAAVRFDEVQRAYHQLSAARQLPVARPEYDRAPDEPGRTRVMRDPGGAYGFPTEASPGIFIQPTSVDFGHLTPERPRADAKVTVAWTGAAPARLESTQGSEWWANLGSEQPAKSCVVFFLRAHAHAGVDNGPQQAEFTVIVDDTTLTVQLTAEIQGEFPPGSRPDFRPRPRPGAERQRFAISAEQEAWLAVIIVLVIVLAVVIGIG